MPVRRSARPAGWRCPRCGRRFRQATREHSCDVTSLAAHLARASVPVKATFEALEQALAAIGPHAVVPVKTMILLRATANFAGVMVRRECLRLEFVLERPVDHARIDKRQQFGPRRHTHHIRLTSPGDVDAQVVSWLRESYRTVAEA
jgi:uncharacterized protein DUF5655